MSANVYKLQNFAIHKARAELEQKGIIAEGQSLEMCRYLAGKINLGIQSVSKLSLDQRHTLIEHLVEMGATVRNPHVYESDRRQVAGGRRGKIVGFSEPKEAQLKMVDALAAQVRWKEQDGYLRFCHRVIKAPRPRNSREVTTLRLALQSLIDQQRAALTETLVDSYDQSRISSVQ